MILIYYKTWIYQCLIIQVKSPSIYMVLRPGLGSDPSLGSGRESGRDIVHVPVGWRPCLVSLLDVPAGLEPPSSLLVGANRLRAVPPDFSMVGGFGLFRITGQAGLGLNKPWLGLWSSGFKNHGTQNDTVS